MPDLVAWLNNLFDAAPDKTSSGLADALDIDKSAVTRMKKGERQLKAEEIPKICAYFGAPSPFGAAPVGFAEDETLFGGAPAASAPLFESAADGDCWRINRSAAPIDERPRAPHFGKAAMVFGLYAPDGAMAPRFKPGEIVWVDPARPARAGDDALFLAAAEDGGERAVLGEYVGERGGKHVFRQHRDGSLRDLDASIWKALYVLPRY